MSQLIGNLNDMAAMFGQSPGLVQFSNDAANVASVMGAVPVPHAASATQLMATASHSQTLPTMLASYG